MTRFCRGTKVVRHFTGMRSPQCARALCRVAAGAVFAVLLSSGLAYSDQASSGSAESFVRALYKSLVASGDPLDDPSNRERLLDPDLAALYQRYAATQTGPGISISLCDCQEGPVTGVRIRVVTAMPDRAVVEAAFYAASAPRLLRLIVEAGGGRWRVADIQNWINPAHPWSVRRAIALDLAANPGPVRPVDTVGRWAGQDCRRDWTEWSWDGYSLSFASPTGSVDVERWVAALPDGFATETLVGANTRPGVRWEYHFDYQEVRVRNVSTGRSFILKPCP